MNIRRHTTDGDLLLIITDEYNPEHVQEVERDNGMLLIWGGTMEKAAELRDQVFEDFPKGHTRVALYGSIDPQNVDTSRLPQNVNWNTFVTMTFEEFCAYIEPAFL